MTLLPQTAPLPFAAQQPDWDDHPDLDWVRSALAAADPLVTPVEIARARTELADAASGACLVLQIGDCAESFHEDSPADVADKLAVLGSLAALLRDVGGRPVVQVGRMGGQYAKPRSQPYERHGDRELPAFRGHMINSELPTVDARRHDPGRMVVAYQAARLTHRMLAEARRSPETAGRVPVTAPDRPEASAAAHRATGGCPADTPGRTGPWSSHEALILDYEGPLVRSTGRSGDHYLGSTHLPWIGERTRHLDGAHVRLLESVRNPVGCKVGPTAAPDEIAAVCDRLDPYREPGKLVLIPRMGSDLVEDRLEPLVRRIHQRGHRPVWLCDPMHGNTVKLAGGLKTRYLSDIAAEVRSFRRVLERCRIPAAGLHLEVAARPVTECIGGAIADETALGSRYTTLCDPRLNAEQAAELLASWA